MLNSQLSIQGFTLLELLLSLLLTSLMVLGIAQYLTVSSKVQLTIQQETLAARTLESLLLQAYINPSSQEDFERVFSSNSCPTGALSTQLDFTHWCQALVQLPQLTLTSNSTSLSLDWRAPTGNRKLVRPAFQTRE